MIIIYEIPSSTLGRQRLSYIPLKDIGTRRNSGTKLKSDNEVTETRDRSSKNAGGVRWGIAGM